MYIVDWDQFWLTLAEWWFFVDWDEIWLSVGAWFGFAGFHLTIFEFVGDLDDTPPRVVSVRAAYDGTAAVWDINDAYRTSGCRVGGHGIYHDHAFCARLPVSMPAAPVAVTPSYPYLASYAVFLLSFASVRLLSSCTRRRETNHEQ